MSHHMKHQPTVQTYIFDNMQEGVMLLDGRGMIDYINPYAAEVFGLAAQTPDLSFLTQSLLQDRHQNDNFHQFVLDAVYDKTRIHKGTVTYETDAGQTKWLEVRTSFWTAPDQTAGQGILILFTDVTDRERLQRERNDATTVLSLLVGFVSLWVILVELMEFLHLELPSYVLTYILIALGAAVLIYFRKKTSLSFGDMGLSFRGIGHVLLVDTLISVVLVAAMAGLKALLLRLGFNWLPEGQPFWYFRVTSLGMLLYPISVVGQEFISRGVMHECLRKVLHGKHREFYAILLSSLLFSALHVERGFAFMLGAALLLSAMGVVYLRQKTIWGLCIPHYVLTMAAIFLGFL